MRDAETAGDSLDAAAFIVVTKRIAIGVIGTLLSLALLGGTTSAQDRSPSELDTLYHETLLAMRKLPEPAALTFRFRISQEFAGTASVREADVVLRTSDGLARWTERRQMHEGYFFLRPDLFVTDGQQKKTASTASDDLPALVPDSGETPAPPSAVIGRSMAYARVYDIREDTEHSDAACPNGRHLTLVPLSDPDVHDLRELWIDPATKHLCKAIVDWRIGRINDTPFVIAVTLQLDDRGFVERFSSDGVAHDRNHDYPYHVAGALERVAPLATSPADL